MPHTQHPIELLRFNTCGSVDDGKSTLIGRLLYDSKSLMEDQIEAMEKSADITGGGQINLANLTDGLRAEREQGITIDVAYRYFATPKRKFIVADTPGMCNTRATWSRARARRICPSCWWTRGRASSSRRGGTRSSRRCWAFRISSSRSTKWIWWSGRKSAFRKSAMRSKFSAEARQFSRREIHSDERAGRRQRGGSFQKTPWYDGPSLLDHLETVHIASDRNLNTFRFPVQWVNRPNNPTDKKLHDFRGLSGQIASGIVRKGSGSRRAARRHQDQGADIWTYDGSLDEAFCPQSVTLCLEHDIDISRGDMLVGVENLPGRVRNCPGASLLDARASVAAGKKYFLKHATQTVQAIVTKLESRINMTTLEPEPDPAALAINDIGGIRIKTAKPIVFDGYTTNHLTGSFILIEQGTNATVAAGMLSAPTEAVKPEYTDFAI
jgi:sulfate adenylyltransferase subunit 1